MTAPKRIQLHRTGRAVPRRRPPRAGERMTAPTDTDVAGQALYAALPTRAQVHVTRTKRLDHLAAEAFARGWTLDQLVTRLTTGDLGFSPGGTITHRLEQCAETAPPKTGSHGRIIPFCTPECRENGGWLLVTDFDSPRYGYPTGDKCPCRTGASA